MDKEKRTLSCASGEQIGLRRVQPGCGSRDRDSRARLRSQTHTAFICRVQESAREELSPIHERSSVGRVVEMASLEKD